MPCTGPPFSLSWRAHASLCMVLFCLILILFSLALCSKGVFICIHYYKCRDKFSADVLFLLTISLGSSALSMDSEVQRPGRQFIRARTSSLAMVPWIPSALYTHKFHHRPSNTSLLGRAFQLTFKRLPCFRERQGGMFTLSSRSPITRGILGPVPSGVSCQ